MPSAGYSHFAYSRFAYSRFAYSHFAYSRFAYSQILPHSRLAYTCVLCHTLLAFRGVMVKHAMNDEFLWCENMLLACDGIIVVQAIITWIGACFGRNMVTKMQNGKNLSLPVIVLILVPHPKVSNLLEQTSLIWLRTVTIFFFFSFFFILKLHVYIERFFNFLK